IGTYNEGINYVNLEYKFNHYRESSSATGLSSNLILSIFEDSKNNIWIATDGGGLNCFNLKTEEFTVYRHDPRNPNSICGDFVLSVTEDSRGHIWMGTW